MFSEQVKKAIKKSGWSISSVAKKMGITQSALSQQINNETLTCVNALRISAIINCPPSVLLQDADEDNTLYITCPHCAKRIRIRVDDAERTANE